MPRHFMIGNTFCGSAPDEAESILWSKGGTPLRLSHWAFLCPSCGEVWARAPIEPDHYQSVVSLVWEARNRVCLKCGSGHILSFHERFNAHSLRQFIPRGVLEWELALSFQKENSRASNLPT